MASPSMGEVGGGGVSTGTERVAESTPPNPPHQGAGLGRPLLGELFSNGPYAALRLVPGSRAAALRSAVSIALSRAGLSIFAPLRSVR